MSWGISLIVLGVLAAYSLIVAKKPEAAKLLDKVTPYQGWIGIFTCLWGIWGIIWAIISIGLLGLGLWGIIWWITLLAGSVLEAVLGFILGYALISKYALSKNEEAKKKGEQVLAKLAPLSGTLGIIAIIFGVWLIVAWIIF
ncbi:hypothetical protein JXM67_00490 [candidate division WOR-3 bacterium]|nr:hypothetical protein [candidate division WOR-3 bacterium]